MTRETVAIAVSAATFAWTIVWSIWQYRRQRRPTITITAGRSLRNRPDGLDRRITISVVNAGQVTVTLNEVRLSTARDGGCVTRLDEWKDASEPLPAAILPGHQWR